VIDWPHISALRDFYGNPDANNDGLPDTAWEAANLTYVTPAYPMVWSWSGQPATRIKIHRKVADSLSRILANIESCFTPEFIAAHQLNQCGGGYNFRPMRGGSSLSLHAYGAAIDLAPALNPLGKAYDPDHGMMPMGVVHLFEQEGWVWGGLWQRGDAMHFQATA